MAGKVMDVCDSTARGLIATLQNAFNGLARVAHTGSYNDLTDKPTIPTAQVNSDWNATSGVAEILHKPTLATVATSGSYNDLSNKPSIPAEQVNSDWNATSGKAQILNKPTLATVATSGSYNDLSNKPTIPTVNNATLTIQKNGTNVQTFTANQSSNATANITVPTKTSQLTNDSSFATTTQVNAKEPKVSWTTTGNWNYYKDGGGRYHLHYRESATSRNFSGTIGSLKYIPSQVTINFPVTLTAVHSAVATLQISNDVGGITIQNFGSSSISLWLWCASGGSKACAINMDIVST